MKTIICTFYELTEEEKKQLAREHAASTEGNNTNTASKPDTTESATAEGATEANSNPATPDIDEKVKEEKPEPTDTVPESTGSTTATHDTDEKGKPEPTGITRFSCSEKPIEKRMKPADIQALLEEIIINLEKDDDNMAEAVHGAKDFLSAYKSVIKAMANPASSISSFDEVTDIIRSLKRYDITRKELLEYLKRLQQDIKSVSISEEILELLLSFKGLPLDSHAKELLNTLTDKLQSQSIRF